MARYVPKTYNNKRVLRMLIRLVMAFALIAAILFVSLFFWLKDKYGQHYPDGTFRLEIPFLAEETQTEE